METNNKVRNVLSECLDLDVSTISDTDKLLDGELYLDSLMTINIIIALEDEFKIEFDDDDINYEFFLSINNMCQIIKRYLSSL